jgi:glucose-6-phosphate 1-dehydrogenase
MAIAIGANVLMGRPDGGSQGKDIEMLVTRQPSGDEVSPYELLLGEAMKGNTLLFTRWDAVEAAWRIVEPVLGSITPVNEYKSATWGPKKADKLIKTHGVWSEPKG